MFSTTCSNVSPVVPRRGESLTAAIWRAAVGTDKGLSDLDHVAVRLDDRATTERLLDEALALNAELIADRDRLRAELAKANQLIETLMDIIEGEAEEQASRE
jgi:hypothetical protein